MNEKIKYWLDMADYDLETARAMLISKRYLYVGFMCHQTIEKILKAFYVHIHAKNPPFTHNLSYLAVESGLYDQIENDQKDFIDFLEPLNIEARYPTYKEKLLQKLNHQRCTEILKQSEAFYQWIKKSLLNE